MERLIHKYAEKLIVHGLAEPVVPLVGGLDAELLWTQDDPRTGVLADVFDALSINSLLCCRPAEPYASIIDYLAAHSDGVIFPSDCESRTFLHDLPVAAAFTAAPIAAALRGRKSVIVPGEGVVTFGTVSPEQAFVTFSSVCFAAYVKFHLDYLRDVRAGMTDAEQQALFERVWSVPNPLPEEPPELMRGPFGNEEDVYRALCEAGELTVRYRMVDSFFGNISYLAGDTLYISQTGSSLDELGGHVDPCPLDGSSCAGMTASSELTAHREVLLRTGARALLHGHPKFAVVLSMDCQKCDCPLLGECHIKCEDDREVCGVPIVPGEVGAGRYGLCNTLPGPLAAGHPATIVYGHGLFTTGRSDFNDAFATLLATERACRTEYYRRIRETEK